MRNEVRKSLFIKNVYTFLNLGGFLRLLLRTSSCWQYVDDQARTQLGASISNKVRRILQHLPSVFSALPTCT